MDVVAGKAARGAVRGANSCCPMTLETVEPPRLIALPLLESAARPFMALPKPCVAGSIPAGGTSSISRNGF